MTTNSVTRVLVVDDSAYVRKVVSQIISRSPFMEVVGTARDGQEALEQVVELRPDVVTCDLIMPNLDTANVAYQMIKVLADALPVGPILIGPARPAHILTPSVTARGVLNMTAVAAVEAQERAGRQQPSLFV